MNDAVNQGPSEGEPSAPLLDLNFAPAWARKPPSAGRQGGQGESSDHGEESRRAGFGRERRDFRREGGGRPPAARAAPAAHPLAGRAMPRPVRSAHDAPDPRAARDLRGPRDPRDDRRNVRPPREELPQLPIEIRVMPEPKALSSIVRRVLTTHRAYPLRDIARLFLDNPAACLVRIERTKDATIDLFQCARCGMPGLTADEIRAHAAGVHFAETFTVEEVEGEPPSGSFPCVARCGLSGELLGPPNHHSYNARVLEMLRTRYANMTEEAYRSRIETVRDPAVIEQWREQSRHRKVYRLKSAATEPAAAADEAAPAPETPADPPAGTAPATAEPALARPLDRQGADALFTRDILPGLVLSVRQLTCPLAIAIEAPDRNLSGTIRDALNREDRFPASLFFALRGAFRHRGLHLFRVHDARGPDFVMARPPVLLDASHAVDEVRLALEYVMANPGCTRTELLSSTAPESGDPAARQRLATQLNWLVEKGHLIEYFNGVLAPPAEFPVFRVVEAPPPSAAAPAAPAPAAVPATSTPVAAQPTEDPAAGAPSQPPAADLDALA